MRAVLDQWVPGWDARRAKKTSDDRIAELGQFVAEHDRLPRAKTSGVSPEEASLAVWLQVDSVERKLRARK